MQGAVESRFDLGSSGLGAGRANGRRDGLVLLALFLIIYGAKSMLIGALGSPLPYSDQWNFEAVGLYRPYLAGTLDWGALVAPYNEHRMLFTRLLLLGLFELGGGWDPILAMLVNALLHTAFAVLFTAFLLPIVEHRLRPLLMAFAALCFLLPLGFENTLMGMNSHFYIFLLLSFGGLVLTAGRPALSAHWIGGLACLLGLEFTLASGALTPIAAGLVSGLQLAVGSRRRTVAEIVAALALVVLGVTMAFAVSHDAASVALEAKSPLDLLDAAISVAALPLATVVGAIVVHAPLGWLLGDTLRRRPVLAAREWSLLALAAWIAAQILAIAYSRYQMALASRYFDIIVPALPLDLVALCLFLARAPRPRWTKVCTAGWVFVIVAAISIGGYLSSWRLATQEKRELDASLPLVTAFVATGDARQLDAVTGWLYPSKDGLARLLSDPAIQLFLPEAVRPPGLFPDGPRNETRLRGRLAGGAMVLKEALGAGQIWMALGVALMFFVGWRRLSPGEALTKGE